MSRLPLLVVGACLLGAGCVPPPTPIGQWTATLPSGGQVEVEYRKDGTATQKVKIGAALVTMQMSYELKGDTMMLLIKSVDAASLPAEVQARVKESMPKQAYPMLMKFEGEKLTLTPGEGAPATAAELILTRKKA